MTPKILGLMAAVSATPALAHSGAHLHPHGSGDWLTVALALGLIALAAAIWVRK
ncbi:hypothetical protein PGB28_05965 [Primorskyibacter aestuariivivens]|uniref:hypothetical protein n=1 Tax=Primorskyibacter aestuariivivens TaxID=1888912 RepID=UPI0023015948|nr:hypothetical protein [Primorskyibacter aestuariivivens]MDA7427995.1 hypothetical protein [Primorskyibacter aestuariivivens]